MNELKKVLKLDFYKKFELTVYTNGFLGYSDLKKFDMYLDKVIDKVLREDDSEDILEKLSVVCFLHVLKDFNKKNEFKMVFLDNAINRLISEIRISDSLTLDDINIFFYRITDTMAKYYGINIIPNFKNFDMAYYYILDSKKNKEDMFSNYIEYMKPELSESTIFTEWIYFLYDNYGERLLDRIDYLKADDEAFKENIIELPDGYSKIVIFENLALELGDVVKEEIDRFIKKYFNLNANLNEEKKDLNVKVKINTDEEASNFKLNILTKKEIRDELYLLLYNDIRLIVNGYMLFLAKEFEDEE